VKDVWAIVSPSEREIVDILEANLRHKVLERFHLQEWACSLCFSRVWRLYGKGFAGVREHMQKAHSVQDPRLENGDFYLSSNVDSRHIVPEIVALIPQTVPPEALDAHEKSLLGEGRATYHRLPAVCS